MEDGLTKDNYHAIGGMERQITGKSKNQRKFLTKELKNLEIGLEMMINQIN